MVAFIISSNVVESGIQNQFLIFNVFITFNSSTDRSYKEDFNFFKKFP